MFTLGDLKTQLRPALWPSGEPENLVTVHDRMFVEALVTLQQFDECLQINNTQVIPQCNSFFKCGLTVIDAPRGRIKKLYVVDKINQTTGQEDASVATDYCSEVDYRQVDYEDLNRYISQSLAGTLPFGFWNWCGIGQSFAGLVAFPDVWAQKYAYPGPDDAGLEKAPPLPPGFHYAQTSTDSPSGSDTQTNLTGQRAQYGLWAIKGGQIFIAPWIQSTETIIVEWDGIKRNWTDADRVDDDPKLKEAVEAYVRWRDNERYQKDYDAAMAAHQAYDVAYADLIHECREETRIRETGGMGDSDGSTSSARGASLVKPVFVNDAQTQTANCPQNTTGNPVTYTVPQGTVTSDVSVADANAKAKSLALQLAGQQLTCTDIPVTYYNTTQSYTATCGTGIGAPVTIQILAGQISSIVSQAAADAEALALATSQAIAALSCTYQNAEQSYTASCPEGSTGSDVTKTVPAGTYTSTVSQADADAQALADATVQANAALVCSGAPPVFTNTLQTITRALACATLHGLRTLTATVQIPPGMFSSVVSQVSANNAAIQYGNTLAGQQLQIQCQQLRAGG